jgi:hypothetical protein
VSHTDLGEQLVAVGSVLVFVSAVLNMATRDGTAVRAIGRAVNAVVGPLTRPLRAFHARLGESPAARCGRQDAHVPRWDNYHEHCARCGRVLLDVVVDGVGTVREEWVYRDDPRIVPEPLLTRPDLTGDPIVSQVPDPPVPPRSPSGVGTLADDLRRSSNAVVEAWVAEANRVLDEARYARPIEYGRRGDPLRRVRIDPHD